MKYLNQIFIKLKTRLLSSDFNKNVFTLVLGTSAAQLITFLLYPVISRLYTPHEFGLFGVFLSVSGMFALISTGRYELAIILPEDDRKAFHLLVMSFLVNILLTLFVLALCVVVSIFNIRISGDFSDLNQIVFLIPLFIALTGASNIMQNWYIRKKQFRLLSISKIVMSLTNNGIVLIMGLINIRLWGLFAGVLISLLIVVVYYFLKFRLIYNSYKLEFTNREMKEVSFKYIDFPKANTLHALSDFFQSQGIIYFLALFFSSATVGLYAFAMRILQAPMMLVVSSFTQVFYQKATEIHNTKQALMPFLKNTVLKMLVLSSPIMILLLLFGPELFSFVFGEKWRDSGVYASMLAPWICLDFVRYSIAQTPLILGKVKQVLAWSLTGNGLIVLVMIAGSFLNFDILNTFILLSITMTLYTFLQILWIFKITRYANH
jgi:O-antigen/teichoic acid export membrane protein